MRSCSCNFAISRASFSDFSFILSTNSAAFSLASSFESFGFLAPPFGTSSTSSRSASASCSTIHVTACSKLSVPVKWMARVARLSPNPISSSCFSRSSLTVGATISGSSVSIFSAASSIPCSVRSSFISASVFTAPCSSVLSTNSECPVRCVCNAFSVALRHGFLHSKQTKVSTASSDSLKFEWPVISPWSCASLRFLSIDPQSPHTYDFAIAIVSKRSIVSKRGYGQRLKMRSGYVRDANMNRIGSQIPR
mmetsp:Transcript_23489/g.39345  ORF Transcript_23489/g.39345 Transcript_23489/m.39345 type:complete len:251 (+) Transcript_23489:870-1622(+)